MCDGKLVTPLTNLHCYVESGSRIIVDLIGTTNGGGCYDTIKNWLSDLTGNPIQLPDGDLGQAFDNNQKIGKAWPVSEQQQIQNIRHYHSYLDPVRKFVSAK